MKSPLYTRTGDTGTTSLVGGQRVPKNSPHLEAYGTVDEFSSQLGLLAAQPDCPQDIRTTIHTIQSTLFNIGAYLATEPPATPYGLTPADIQAIEQEIDRLDADTPPIRSFILPGGSIPAAQAHIARTICRRAERRILDLHNRQPIHPLVTEYMNRLSDYLFIVAKNINHRLGAPEILWQAPAR